MAILLNLVKIWQTVQKCIVTRRNHAIDDQNNGRWVSANQPMIEHRPHVIQLYLDQWPQYALFTVRGIPTQNEARWARIMAPCCVSLACVCDLHSSSSKDMSFHRFPVDQVAGIEWIFKSRRGIPLL